MDMKEQERGYITRIFTYDIETKRKRKNSTSYPNTRMSIIGDNVFFFIYSSSRLWKSTRKKYRERKIQNTIFSCYYFILYKS